MTTVTGNDLKKLEDKVDKLSDKIDKLSDVITQLTIGQVELKSEVRGDIKTLTASILATLTWFIKIDFIFSSVSLF